MLKYRIDPAVGFVFGGLTALWVWESLLAYLITNSAFGTTDDAITGVVRFAYTYWLTVFLISLAVYNQYVRKVFRYSWFVPVMYFLLCFYAAMRAEGRSLNGILGFVFRPLASVALMLSCEYLIICARTVTWRKILDALFLFLCVFGSAIVIKQLLFGLSETGDFLVTNNIYFLIPLFCYWMTKRTKWVVWVVPLLMVAIALLSLKRGAIIVTVGMACISVIARSKKSDLVSLVFRIALVLILLAGAYKIVDEKVFHGYISERFETVVDGSGRAGQFKWVFEELQEASFGDIVIGHGMGDSQVKFYGEFIHNDWFLLIYDFGVIGMFIYACIYVYFLKNAYRLWRQNSPYAAAWATCCVFCVCLSLYSAVTWLYIFNVLPVMGCIMGLERQRTQTKMGFLAPSRMLRESTRGIGAYRHEPTQRRVVRPPRDVDQRRGEPRRAVRHE